MDFIEQFQKQLVAVSPLPLGESDLAKLLKENPAALAAFNEQYEKGVLGRVSDNFFEQNSRQAAERSKIIDVTDAEPTEPPGSATELHPEDIIDRATAELVADTPVWAFDGNIDLPKIRSFQWKPLPPGTPPVTMEELQATPKELRPMVTGTTSTFDMAPDAAPILESLEKAVKLAGTKEGADAYARFRQGLDLMDLSVEMYDLLGQNINSMEHWLPQLVDACTGTKFFKIPATTIVQVPYPLLQLTRTAYESINPATMAVVDGWAQRVFGLTPGQRYFIKTGTYSSKFDFRNAIVTDPKEVMEIGQYLLYIHGQANQMCGPLVRPRPVLGASTTNTWVVREFIPDSENNPTIYKGLPLRTEYRAFIDCDAKLVLGIHPYWEPDGMKAHLAERGQKDPHYFHDFMVFQAHEETMMARYLENAQAVVDHIKEILPRLDLTGQWSLDIMQNGNDFWLIDMARAEQSTFYEQTVPPALRRPTPETWGPFSLMSPIGSTSLPKAPGNKENA